MKFPDGGYRPGYNVQFATDTETGVDGVWKDQRRETMANNFRPCSSS